MNANPEQKSVVLEVLESGESTLVPQAAHEVPGPTGSGSAGEAGAESASGIAFLTDSLERDSRGEEVTHSPGGAPLNPFSAAGAATGSANFQTPAAAPQPRLRSRRGSMTVEERALELVGAIKNRLDELQRAVYVFASCGDEAILIIFEICSLISACHYLVNAEGPPWFTRVNDQELREKIALFNRRFGSLFPTEFMHSMHQAVMASVADGSQEESRALAFYGIIYTGLSLLQGFSMYINEVHFDQTQLPYRLDTRYFLSVVKKWGVELQTLSFFSNLGISDISGKSEHHRIQKVQGLENLLNRLRNGAPHTWMAGEEQPTRELTLAEFSQIMRPNRSYQAHKDQKYIVGGMLIFMLAAFLIYVLDSKDLSAKMKVSQGGVAGILMAAAILIGGLCGKVVSYWSLQKAYENFLKGEGPAPYSAGLDDSVLEEGSRGLSPGGFFLTPPPTVGSAHSALQTGQRIQVGMGFGGSDPVQATRGILGGNSDVPGLHRKRPRLPRALFSTQAGSGTGQVKQKEPVSTTPLLEKDKAEKGYGSGNAGRGSRSPTGSVRSTGSSRTDHTAGQGPHNEA